MNNFFDIHTHLHDKAFDEDRSHVLLEMEHEGIRAITVGTDFEESRKAVALAEEHENLFATVGMHPIDNRGEGFVEEQYESLLTHPKVVAIGECGLDYYRLEEDKEKGFIVNLDDEVDRQKSLFERHIDLAVKHNMPLMLHGRPKKGTMDAYEDMVYMLTQAQRKYGKEQVRGNVHFFVGNKKIAQQFIDIGFTLSFSGVITFAKEFEEVISALPLEMIHAETDSPYATPAPHRGKRNSSLYIPLIVEKIAEIKRMTTEEVRAQLAVNAKDVFGV